MRLVGLFLMVVLFACTEIQSQSANQSDNHSSQTTMSSFRQLAEKAFQSFQAGDNVAAANAARSLEVAWDNNSSTLQLRFPDIWDSIDHAMDKFIKPIMGFDHKAPDPQAVSSAYSIYLSSLSGGDKVMQPVIDNSLDVTKTSSGLVCVITKHGTGRQPKEGEIVVLRVTGLFGNGEQYRRTSATDEPSWFWLLSDRTPLGLIEGMSLLHVGDSAILLIPPGLGFGPKGGHGGAIPPNAMLTYFVDLLDVKSNDLANQLQETMVTKGIDGAVGEYRELQKRGFPDLFLGQMNAFGNTLLENGKRSEAITIFKLNIERDPESPKVYFNLGRAYAADGQRNLAIENYKKALSIDPNMAGSIKALKELLGN
jgi:hypothetical protein